MEDFTGQDLPPELNRHATIIWFACGAPFEGPT